MVKKSKTNYAYVDVKILISESKVSQNHVARELGISESSLSNMLSRGSLKYNLFKKIIHILGYKLAWVERK